jgi:hypothetical protein
MSLSSIAVIVTSVLAVAAVGLVTYTKMREERYTHERYALRCVTATASLVLAAITAISSHKGFIDHFLDLLSAGFGISTQDATPAPLSEKFLIVILVAVAIYFIMNSHKSWHGLISEQEAERRRTRRPNHIGIQALEEAHRIITRNPDRIADYGGVNKRIYEISDPPQPDLVWHEYARDLFELWYSTCDFAHGGSPSWDQRMRCWSGKETRRGLPLFLFCWHSPPSEQQLGEIVLYIKETMSVGAGYAGFILHREKFPTRMRTEIKELEIISEEYLLDNIVDFTDYYTHISNRVNAEPAADANVTISEIYAPSALATLLDEPVSDDFGDYLAHWANTSGAPHLAILGEYGQGKSTGAVMYVHQAIESGLAKSGGRVPVLIELRGKSPANLLPAELLGTWAQRYRIHAAAMMNLLMAGKLLLIFDGFDEMANVSDVDARLGHFKALWKFALPKTRIMFTGRRNLFFADQELQLAFKGTEGDTSRARCEILQLCPFDLQKIRLSLRWMKEPDSREEIVAAAQSAKQILDIVSRPSLLYIVATLWSDLRPLFRGGIITSAQVIDRFIFHSYQRQAEKGRDYPEFMRLSTTERRYFHEGVAVFMGARGETNQITNGDLEAAIERLFEAYPDDAHITEQVRLEMDGFPLKKRMGDRKTALEAVGTDVRTHGILVTDSSRQDTFKFAHKSFYELLFAKVFAYGLLGIDKAFYRSIRDAMDEEVGDVEGSREVMQFFAEILVSKLREEQKSQVFVQVFDVVTGNFGRPKMAVQMARWRWRLMGMWLCSFPGANLVVAYFAMSTAVFFASGIWLALGGGMPVTHGRVSINASLILFVEGAGLVWLTLSMRRAMQFARKFAAICFFGNGAFTECQALFGRRAAVRLAAWVTRRWPGEISVVNWVSQAGDERILKGFYRVIRISDPARKISASNP